MTSTHSRTISVAVATLAILTSVAGPLGAARAETVFEVVQRFPSGSANLTIGSDGNVYGVESALNFHKTAFRIHGAGTFTTLHTFSTFGWLDHPPPGSRLVVGQDGALYGPTPNFNGSGPT